MCFCNLKSKKIAQQERSAAIQAVKDFHDIERNVIAEGNKLTEEAWRRKAEADKKKKAEAEKKKADADLIVAAAIEKKKAEAVARKIAVAEAKEKK